MCGCTSYIGNYSARAVKGNGLSRNCGLLPKLSYAIEIAMVANSIALMPACKRWVCQHGRSRQVKWSAEVLDGQLVSAVWRSSVGTGCTLVCINCSCCSITARSTVFALASTRIRRLFRHWQAVRSVRRSCSLKIPAKISVLCKEADVCSSICCARETLRTYS